MGHFIPIRDQERHIFVQVSVGENSGVVRGSLLDQNRPMSARLASIVLFLLSQQDSCIELQIMPQELDADLKLA